MPSQKLRQFIEGDRLEKEGRKQKDETRSYVERLLRKAKGMGIFLRGIAYQEREKVKFDDLELFNWVKSQCFTPITNEDGIILRDKNGKIVRSKTFDIDLWNRITKVVIDESELEAVVDEGLMDLSDMPDTCYNISTSKVITITHSKLNQ